MRSAPLMLCLCALAGCARSAVEPNFQVLDAGGGENNPDTDAALADGAVTPAEDGGDDPPIGNQDAGNNQPDGDTPAKSCTANTLTCETAMSLGEIDASDANSTVSQQGKGSGWYAVDLRDGNKNSTGTIRIGVSVTLTTPAGSSYAVTLSGDTGPSGGGRCVAADVTDTDPLAKTAIWGSFGPTTAKKRQLAVHVEHLSGPCDADWTLTLAGDPCPVLSIGSGENSMGSCP